MPIQTPYGLTSAGNSSTTPLGSSATFTGTGEQNNFAMVGVMVKTDAAGTLFFDFSNDGTNWDSTFPVSGFGIAANIPEFHTAVKLGRYFRVRLVNGTDAQTFLRITTYYGNNFTPSVAPINQAVSIDSDAILVRSTDPIDEIRVGHIGGAAGFTKWGFNSDIDSAAQELIGAQGGSYDPPATSDTYTITFNNTTDGLGNTGATQLAITYINTDGDETTALVTLDASGSQVTAFSGYGINRVAVSASGSANQNNNDITIAHTSGNTEAFVPATYGVTQQAIYHNGANSDAIAKYLLINILKVAGGGGDPRVTLHGYVFNRQFSTKYDIFDHFIDTGVENTVPIHDPVGFLLSPTDTIWFEAETDTNNTSVNLRFSGITYQRS